MAVEDKYYNPAKLKVGGIVSVNTIDYANCIFVVKEIWQWTRNINGNKRIFADYRILARPHDGQDVELIVRVIPRENPEKDCTHHFCVLRKFFECNYDQEEEREGILRTVNDKNGQLVYKEGQPEEERFFRIHTPSAYYCDVAVISDTNGDGKVEEDEIHHEKWNLWDYSRETLDEAGQPMIEYLFVQQDLEYKDFVMWRGEEVLPDRIKV